MHFWILGLLFLSVRHVVNGSGPVVNMLLHRGDLNSPLIEELTRHHETTTPDVSTPEPTTQETTSAEWTTPEATTPEATTPEATTPWITQPKTTTQDVIPKGLLLNLLRNMYDDANTMSALARGLTDKVTTVEHVADHTKTLLLQVIQHVGNDIAIISQMTRGLIDDIKTAEDIAHN
ncbi:uncharacterized protein LOC127837327 [Dreissena polymorpha]|uniref:Uncharacterized protein n=1 Tax=Dreissena polymorpha TaxID=45954 RepID=A0A9D4FJ15_DREPO|nr:uncharacterized protein LOC127837327 [Dreissena polymorpha]KAH3798916.1 hypothetical protein DPMN_152520 [Dreissena polymorpha]